MDTPPMSSIVADELVVPTTPLQTVESCLENGKSDVPLDRVATPLEACPRSTIRPTGAQAGAVFGASSGGGVGSLTYEDDDDDDDNSTSACEEVSPDGDGGITLLASPRQTRAPPCTPMCNEIGGFRWPSLDDEKVVQENELSSHKTLKKTLWGTPYSDMFGSLSDVAAHVAPHVNSQPVESDNEEQKENDQDKQENEVKMREFNDHETDAKEPQRRTSLFSFHLSSSLIRASQLLSSRRSSTQADEDVRALGACD